MTKRSASTRNRPSSQAQRAKERDKLKTHISTLIMEIEASQFLQLVQQKGKTALHRFNKLVPLLQAPGYLAKLDNLEQSFAKANFSEFMANDFDDNDKRFFLYMLMAITLRPHSGFDQPIHKAFSKANLNPEDPVHWRLLTMLLSWSLFPPSSPPGQPPNWDDDRYCKLLKDAYNVTNSEKQTDLAISKKLKLKGYKEKPETLRAALRRARDPSFNSVLGYFVDSGFNTIKDGYESRGLAWPPVDINYLLERIRGIKSSEDMSLVLHPSNKLLNGVAAFQLFNKLRAGDHRRVVQTIRSNGFDAHPVEKFFKSRQAELENTVRDALSGVEDYDACLKILERVLKDDEMEFGLYVLVHKISVDEEDGFAALADKRERDLGSLKKAIEAHYCDQIAKGEVDSSKTSGGFKSGSRMIPGGTR
jgi:hypothetical protein